LTSKVPAGNFSRINFGASGRYLVKANTPNIMGIIEMIIKCYSRNLNNFDPCGGIVEDN
jgi:hypothetical protein